MGGFPRVRAATCCHIVSRNLCTTRYSQNMANRLVLAMLFVISVGALQRPGSTQLRDGSQPPIPSLSAGEFARSVSDLSETGGYFDTDNLISNERSYLHVTGAMERLGVKGGAYIGVGPDQNFSYIARTRAELAFIIDIRRDNLLQHLLFKALFASARTRAEYLALLLGRPLPPADINQASSSIEGLLARIDSALSSEASRQAAHSAVLAELSRLQVPLSNEDRATITRIHATFMTQGLSLRFTSTGRAPRPHYPTLRDLFLETDRRGLRASYVANEADFQYVKELQRRNLVIPVVGDLAGTRAMRAIAGMMRERNVAMSALYASNAEDYVLRGGGFAQYVANVRALPRTARSVIIRSWFGGPGTHPDVAPGYYTVQLLQKVDDFVDVVERGTVWSYRSLVFSPHESP